MTRAEVVARAVADLQQTVGRTIYAHEAYVVDREPARREPAHRSPWPLIRHATFPDRITLRVLDDTRDLDRWTNAETCTPLYHVEPFGSHSDANLALLRTFTVHTVNGPCYTLDGDYRPPAWTLQPTAIDMIRRHTKGQPR